MTIPIKIFFVLHPALVFDWAPITQPNDSSECDRRYGVDSWTMAPCRFFLLKKRPQLDLVLDNEPTCLAFPPSTDGGINGKLS